MKPPQSDGERVDVFLEDLLNKADLCIIPMFYRDMHDFVLINCNAKKQANHTKVQIHARW